MSVNKEQFIAAKQATYIRLNQAINSFYQNPTAKTWQYIAVELGNAVIYNVDVHVPVNNIDGELSYSFLTLKDLGYAYKVCSSPKELEKCEEESSIIIPVRNFFEEVAKDTVAGVVFNPNSGNDAIVFLSTANVRNILKMGYGHIAEQPEDVKEFLLKEI